ncbi:DNA polymerase Y family protein [Geoalkalibacter sp.]|uniref:DNA polymerase Y family protein n=1 Tax=Geoalkalibacter sp. TaxID=3041440 RepID=UPI00272E0536|nr:DNA polymerase IV [Geoalkalibacter sp.]
MERDILHLAIPAFAVSLARVVDASLRERPVAIAPAHSERALLQCVSREALQEGLWEGMPVYRAKRLCPALHLLPPDPILMTRAQQALLKLVGDYSPLIEPAAPGRLFLDLTGSRKLFGPGRDLGARLEKELERRLRLSGTVGVAANKLVARIAAGCLSRPGVCDVLRGAERNFIAPLPVAVLPGIGQSRAASLLQDLNLRYVQELAGLSLTHLRLVVGPFAPLLHQRANGIDPSPVRPSQKAPEVVEESFLPQEDNNDTLLLAELCRLVEACGQRLRRLGQGTGRLGLSLSYVDGLSSKRSLTLPSPLDQDLELYAVAEELFAKACERRVRLKGLRLECTRLGPVVTQVDLFTQAACAPRQMALQKALDHLRGKYGMAAVQRGRTFAA